MEEEYDATSGWVVPNFYKVPEGSLFDQEYDLDLIVMATGFGTMTGSLMKIDISGRGELGLKEK